MILENHTPSFWAIFLLPHTRTHSQMAFLSRWQRGGRADSEGHGDAEKEKKKCLNWTRGTLHSPPPFTMRFSAFSSIDLYVSCVFWILQCDCKVVCLGKKKRKTFFFFPKTIVKVLLNQREKKNTKNAQEIGRLKTCALFQFHTVNSGWPACTELRSLPRVRRCCLISLSHACDTRAQNSRISFIQMRIQHSCSACTHAV